MNCSLRGKPFYCREWVFAKLLHYLDYKDTLQVPGVLLVGGPGSGKSAICTEVAWPTVIISPQAEINSRLLAYHFCQFYLHETLTCTGFVQNVISQILHSPLLSNCGISERLQFDPELASWFEPENIARYPEIAFEKLIQLLNVITPPIGPVLLLVDSLHESSRGDNLSQKPIPPTCPPTRSSSQVSTQTQGGVGRDPTANASHYQSPCNASTERGIMELLGKMHHHFPSWILLVCTARKHWKSLNYLFAGFRKLTIDDLRKQTVVRDVQQYILERLDHDEALREFVSVDTVDYLNMLYVKCNGCVLYVEKILDSVTEQFVRLEEFLEIPGTLNGLYLWLCQRIFKSRSFKSMKSLLSVVMATRYPLSKKELFRSLQASEQSLTYFEFEKRFSVVERLLVPATSSYSIRNDSPSAILKSAFKCAFSLGSGQPYIGGPSYVMFHNSFIEWVTDVKYCTPRFLIDVSQGFNLLTLFWSDVLLKLESEHSDALSIDVFLELAFYLARVSTQNSATVGTGGLSQQHLPIWLLHVAGAMALETVIPESACRDTHSLKLVLAAGSDVLWLPPMGPSASRFLSPLPQSHSAMSMGSPLQDRPFGTLISSGSESIAGTPVIKRVHPKVVANANANILEENDEPIVRLQLATREGNVVQCQMILASLGHGANYLNLVDVDGWTPLRNAAWVGSVPIVKLLLRNGAKVDFCDDSNRTALRAAAYAGHLDVVKCLLEAGADVNSVDKEQLKTPLMAAAYMGHDDIVKALLEHKANPLLSSHSNRICVDARDSTGKTVLHIAVMGGQNQTSPIQNVLKIINLVLKVMKKRESESSKRGSMSSASPIPALSNTFINAQDNNGASALLLAATDGLTEICSCLLGYNVDIDLGDDQGWTPLLATAAGGFLDTMVLLIEHNADVDAIDNEGRTVLSVAASQGDPKIVRLLLDNGLDECHRDNSGWIPSHFAAFEGHSEALKELCSHAGVPTDARYDAKLSPMPNGSKKFPLTRKPSIHSVTECDNEGRHPLLLACQEGHLEASRVLVNAGAPINRPCLSGKTALRFAALEGRLDVCRLLVEAGAEVEARDLDGRAVLHALAARKPTSKSSESLKEDANQSESTPSRATRHDVIEYLIGAGAELNSRDPEGRTALMLSVWLGDLAVCSALLRHGADPNAADKSCRNCLMTSIWQGHLQIMNILLEFHCDVDAACSQGATALHIAAQLGREDIVKVLLEHNADVSKLDGASRQAAEVAESQGHCELARLLHESEQYVGVVGTLSGYSAETKTSGYSSNHGSPGNTALKQVFELNATAFMDAKMRSVGQISQVLLSNSSVLCNIPEKIQHPDVNANVPMCSPRPDRTPETVARFRHSLLERSLPRLDSTPDASKHIAAVRKHSSKRSVNPYTNAVLKERIAEEAPTLATTSTHSTGTRSSNSLDTSANAGVVTPRRTKIITNPRLRQMSTSKLGVQDKSADSDLNEVLERLTFGDESLRTSQV